MTDTLVVFWKVCTQCGHKVVAHGRVKCPECGCMMTPSATAGAIVDNRNLDQ